MKIKDNCKLPWEIIYIILGIVGLAAVIVTGSYIAVAYVFSFIIVAFSSFYAERGAIEGGHKDSYGFRTLRFGCVMLVAVLAALILMSFQAFGEAPATDWFAQYYLTALAVNLVGIFGGWIGSWCERCIEWK